MRSWLVWQHIHPSDDLDDSMINPADLLRASAVHLGCPAGTVEDVRAEDGKLLVEHLPLSLHASDQTATALATLFSAGTVEDVRAEDGKLLVRPDLMSDQVVELELDEVQKLFKVSLWWRLCGFASGTRRNTQ
jgi:hypothetical protein